jgi:hypothetical protein
MGLPLAKIFKQALILVRNNKFLWGLGLFLVWGNLFNFLTINRQDSAGNGSQSEQVSNMIHLTPHQANVWGIAIIAAAAAMIVMYFLSRAGIILAVGSLMDRRPTGFVKSLSQARPFTLKVASVWILSGLSGAVVLLVLAAPVIYLYVQGMAERAVILGLIGLLIYIPVLLITDFVNIFGVLFAVIFRTNVRDSFRSAFDLISVYWWSLVSMEIGLVAMNALWFMFSVLVSSLVFAPFVFLSKIPYDMVSQELGNPMIFAGFSVTIIVFLSLQSIFISFMHSCWTLAFWEVIHGQQTDEEEEKQTVPEVV